MPSFSSAWAGTTPTAVTRTAASASAPTRALRMRAESALPSRARSPTRVFARLLPEQLRECCVEHLAVPIDVRCGRRRTHQRHVVEGRHDDAAVERVEVQVVVELLVDHRLGPTAAARRLRVEVVLGARAELHDAPGRAMALDRRLHALAIARRELR